MLTKRRRITFTIEPLTIPRSGRTRFTFAVIIHPFVWRLCRMVTLTLSMWMRGMITRVCMKTCALGGPSSAWVALWLAMTTSHKRMGHSSPIKTGRPTTMEPKMRQGLSLRVLWTGLRGKSADSSQFPTERASGTHGL